MYMDSHTTHTHTHTHTIPILSDLMLQTAFFYVLHCCVLALDSRFRKHPSYIFREGKRKKLQVTIMVYFFLSQEMEKVFERSFDILKMSPETSPSSHASSCQRAARTNAISLEESFKFSYLGNRKKIPF